MSIARSSVVQSSIAFQYYLRSSRMGSYVQLTQFECIFNRQHLQPPERKPTAELIAFMRCKKRCCAVGMRISSAENPGTY